MSQHIALLNAFAGFESAQGPKTTHRARNLTESIGQLYGEKTERIENRRIYGKNFRRSPIDSSQRSAGLPALSRVFVRDSEPELAMLRMFDSQSLPR